MNSIYYNVRDFGARGESFTTTAHTVAGSNEVTVDSVGSLKVGDEVVIRRGCSRLLRSVIFYRRDNSSVNPRPTQSARDVSDEAYIEGFTGEQGDHVVYFFDLIPEEPDVVYWSRDFGESWTPMPVSSGKMHVEDSIYVTISDFEYREFGATVIFACSSRLTTTVTAINGNVLTVSDAAEITADSELLVSDTPCIQRAIEAAKKTSGTVFIPSGRYLITRSLVIENADSVSLVGESGQSCIFDFGLEQAPPRQTRDGFCLMIKDSLEVNVKNLTLIGHASFAERERYGRIMTRGGDNAYGFYYSSTAAVSMSNVERTLIENCHARKMSGEAFYAASSDVRTSSSEPQHYPKSLTYLRCSVENCARNAFNNNDFAENTSVLYCRIRDVGGCAWEGISRFVKFIGNYIRNAGPVACGNLRNRSEESEILGTAQHVVADNTFESGICYGYAGISVTSGNTQTVIKNNTFVNFNSCAIRTNVGTQYSDIPAEHLIITGNLIDLTAEESESVDRIGINVGCNYVTVSDNQVNVRATKPDPHVTGILVSEGATNIVIHDNTVSLLGTGISVKPSVGIVGTVIDSKHFYRYEPAIFGVAEPPIPRRRSNTLRNYLFEWESGERSESLGCDPETRIFTIAEPRDIKEGEKFFYYSALGNAILLHHNLVNSCINPLVDQTRSPKSAVIKDNIIAEN